MNKQWIAALIVSALLVPIAWYLTIPSGHNEFIRSAARRWGNSTASLSGTPEVARLQLDDLPRVEAVRHLPERRVLLSHFDRAQVEDLAWAQIRWTGIPQLLRSSEFRALVEDARRLGPRASDALVELVGRLGTQDQQAVAVLALGELGDAADVPFIQRILNGATGHAYPMDAACAHSLVQIGSAPARIALSGAMASADQLGRATRLGAAFAQLGEIAIPDILACAGRWSAQQASDLPPHTWIGALPHDINPALLDDVVGHPNATLRAMGVYWRVTAGHADGGELLDILRADESVAVRTAALYAAGLRPSAISIEQLLEFAEDPALGSLAVRTAARQGPSAVRPLVRLLMASRPDSELGCTAVDALVSIGGHESTTELLRYTAAGSAERIAVMHSVIQSSGELDPRWRDLIVEDLDAHWPDDERHQRIAAGVGALLRIPSESGAPNADFIRGVFHAHAGDVATQRAIVRQVCLTGSDRDFAVASDAVHSDDMVTRLLALQMVHHGAPDSVPREIERSTKVELLQTLESGRLSKLATLAQGGHGVTLANAARFLRRTCTQDEIRSLRAAVRQSPSATQERILTSIVRDIESFHAAQARLSDG